MNTNTLVGAVLLVVVAAGGWWLWQGREEVPHTQEQQIVAAGTYTEEREYYSIMVEYPVTSVKERTVMEAAMGVVVAEFKANTHAESLTPEDVEVMGLGDGRRFTLSAEVKTYASGEYTAYVYTVYEDTLGAHPNGYFKTFVFDDAGSEIALGEVLGGNPDWLKELSLAVHSGVEAQYVARTGSSDTSTLYGDGLAPKEENFRSWYLDGSELVVLIPPYQVAAYAVGSFEVRVPLSDVQ